MPLFNNLAHNPPHKFHYSTDGAVQSIERGDLTFSAFLSKSTNLWSNIKLEALHAGPLPLPRPIFPRERSAFDRVIDFLVGEGPSNRYALICSRCNSHNGMALKEEYEYLGEFCGRMRRGMVVPYPLCGAVACAT